MKEADLYADVVSGMLADGLAAYRIQDGSVGKKPFDVGGATGGGLGIACEIKSPTAAEANFLQWGPFERHQVQWLRTYAGLGALALACVYDRERHLLLVWSLRHANDRCARPADAELTRTDGSFRGWGTLVSLRLSQRAAQQHG